jgi:hypothetical protein
MAISETQLDTWSRQGAVITSAGTYATIRSALQDRMAPYNGKNYDIFLQGSYGNDTNIFADSDVDVVIKLNSTFYHDISDLPSEQQLLYNAARTASDYSVFDFKRDVISHLNQRFPSKITPGNKAIYIAADGTRREADVVAAASYRRYSRFNTWTDSSYTEGLTFWTTDDIQIINYPKLHSENCTKKHQETNGWFKPTVRILKNMRNRLIADGRLEEGIAPSYFLEGLLYNVPNALFGSSYGDTFINAINWIRNCPDRSELLCANEQYYLLRSSSPLTWRSENLQAFLNAVISFWNA